MKFFDGQVSFKLPLIFQKGTQMSGANLMGANKLIVYKKEYRREDVLVLL